MTLEFDYYFSFRSPYSYLAAPQVEELIARYDMKPRMRIVTDSISVGPWPARARSTAGSRTTAATSAGEFHSCTITTSASRSTSSKANVRSS